jgi:FtsZ-interacting cell division protein YlmF
VEIEEEEEEEDSEEEEIEEEEEEEEETEEEEEREEEEEERKRRRTDGFQSPNWDVSFKPNLSRSWKKSTSSLSPSKSTKSSITSLEKEPIPSSRTKSSRLCPSRSKLEQDKEPDSRLS